MKNTVLHFSFAIILGALSACGTFAQQTMHGAAQSHQVPSVRTSTAPDEDGFNLVRNIHGLAGPFAVAGYRIGARAMTELGLLRGGFATQVTHEAPSQVQWSCVVDGLQAATGASLGKLNLKLKTVADADKVRSVITDKESGASLEFRFADKFLKRFYNVPIANLETAGRAVLSLSDDEIFTMRVVAKGKTNNPFNKRQP